MPRHALGALGSKAWFGAATPSLAALISGNEDHMGQTDQLSASDKAALVAFLETL